jgi:hypothetical protein
LKAGVHAAPFPPRKNKQDPYPDFLSNTFTPAAKICLDLDYQTTVKAQWKQAVKAWLKDDAETA